MRDETLDAAAYAAERVARGLFAALRVTTLHVACFVSTLQTVNP
jgi:hypothetical protein